MRVLLTGWFSFLHGEATAGDVLALEASRAALAGLPCDVAWSPVFRPGRLTLDAARPEDYTHLVFVCGPAYGPQVRALHERYARCRRIAVGVSVPDPGDPAATGFHRVLARDGGGIPPRRDLASRPRVADTPVAGVVLAPGQGEYGARRRHDEVHERLRGWLSHQDAALLPLDTRLDARDWRLCTTPGQFVALVRRLDVVVTTRLHGLVIALSQGVPALAVDPVDGGAKVTAQARAWDWPVLPAHATAGDLRELWEWCHRPRARAMARARTQADPPLLDHLRDTLAEQPAADRGATGQAGVFIAHASRRGARPTWL